MEGPDRLGAHGARDVAGLPRREVILARPMLGVLVQEDALDKQQIYIGEQ